MNSSSLTFTSLIALIAAFSSTNGQINVCASPSVFISYDLAVKIAGIPQVANQINTVADPNNPTQFVANNTCFALLNLANQIQGLVGSAILSGSTNGNSVNSASAGVASSLAGNCGITQAQYDAGRSVYLIRNFSLCFSAASSTLTNLANGKSIVLDADQVAVLGVLAQLAGNQ